MRFRTRDLLQLTALTSFYSAAFAYAAKHNDAGWGQFLTADDLPIDIVFYGIEFVALIAASIHSRTKIGAALIEWEPTPQWRQDVHSILFLAALTVFLSWGSQVFLPFFVVALGFGHLMQTLNHSAALGESGVFIEGKFLPWGECRLTLEPTENRLNYSFDGKLWPLRFIVYDRHVRVPDEHLVEIERILAERQPACDATS